jgi:hypothetical protein
MDGIFRVKATIQKTKKINEKCFLPINRKRPMKLNRVIFLCSLGGTKKQNFSHTRDLLPAAAQELISRTQHNFPPKPKFNTHYFGQPTCVCVATIEKNFILLQLEFLLVQDNKNSFSFFFSCPQGFFPVEKIFFFL